MRTLSTARAGAFRAALRADAGVRTRDSRTLALTYLEALRPRQWLKSAVTLIAPAAAGAAVAPALWPPAAGAAVCAALAASAGYLLNDVMDRREDSLRPRTAHRPVASGQIPPAHAVAAAAALASAAVVVASVLNGPAVALVVCYLAGALLHSMCLRSIPYIETATIAALFGMRVLLGAAATATPVQWSLVVAASLGAVFAVTLKRRAEKLHGDPVPTRSVLASYTGRGLSVAAATSSALMMAAVVTWAVPLGMPAVLPGVLAAATLGVACTVYAWQPDGQESESPERAILRSPALLLLGASAGGLIAVAGAVRA